MSAPSKHFDGCPGSKIQDFTKDTKAGKEEGGRRQSQLRQWPIQLHLVSPEAPYYQKADVLLAADCVAYSVGDFHKDYLKGKSLAIACPKLDEGQDVYVEKIKSMIDDARINTLTVMTMQVPCCAGLVAMAQGDYAAAQKLNEESLAMAREMHSKADMACALLGLGLAGLAENSLDAAQHILDSLRLRQEIGEPWTLTSSLIGAAELSLHDGNPQRATR